MLRLQIFCEVIVFLPQRWQRGVLWYINAGASKLCSRCLQSSNAPLGAYKVKAAGLYSFQQSQSCSFINSAVVTHRFMCTDISKVLMRGGLKAPSLYLTCNRKCQIPVHTTQFQFSVTSQKVFTLAGVTMVFLCRETSRYLNNMITHPFVMENHYSELLEWPFGVWLSCLLCHL